MNGQFKISHVLIGSFLLLLTACSSIEPRNTSLAGLPEGINDASEELSWKSCYIKITWQEGMQPDWGVDLFLAHAVFGPVLSELGDQLPRWRFHRRAGQDEGGHQFSFLYFSSFDTAVRVNELIDNSEVLNRALDSDALDVVYCYSPDDTTRPDIEDTSDPIWSATMQRHWPAYIMGISSLWLGLIDDAVGSINLEDDLSMILNQYREANNTVTAIWQSEAQHALLHHLNAVFGYQPMIINKALSF
jgi:hypothetical protein